MKRNLAIIKKESEISGLLYLVDGAIFSRCPLLNILAYAKNIPVAVLELVYCQGHLAHGNKKDRTFICNQFLNLMEKIDLDKTLSDIDMFDGASNVQLAKKTFKGALSKVDVHVWC